MKAKAAVSVRQSASVKASIQTSAVGAASSHTAVEGQAQRRESRPILSIVCVVSALGLLLWIQKLDTATKFARVGEEENVLLSGKELAV